VGKINRELERVCRREVEVVSLPKLGGAIHTPGEILAALKG
jgi:hypothetical protein